MRFVTSICVPVLALTCALASAQAQHSGDLGGMSGHVIDGATGRPVVDVDVRVSSTEPGGDMQEVKTDSSGGYSFTRLRRGTYHVSAVKMGYARLIFAGGAKASSRLVSVAGSETVSNIDLQMRRGAAASGRILDRDGEPVVGGTVSAVVRRLMNGRLQVYEQAATAQTDDQGRYRLYGLPAGRYCIRATVRNAPPVFGRDGAPLPRARSSEALLPGYYPGVHELAQAAPVAVRWGDEISGIDFRLQCGPAFTVSGVADLTSLPSGARGVRILLREKEGGWEDRWTFPDKAGAFVIGSVPPGSYRLRAEALDERGDAYLGSYDVQVSDSDRQGLRIDFTAATDIQGVVSTRSATAGASKVPAPNLSVNLYPRAVQNNVVSKFSAVVGNNGQFVVKRVPVDEYFVGFSRMEDFYVKSIKYGGAEVLGRTFGVRPGSTLEIELSPSPGSISGTAKTSSGEPVASAEVLVTTNAVDGTDRRFMVEADQKGTFTLRRLRPGEYRLYAFESFDGSSLDEADLRQFESRSVRVEVSEGTQKAIDIHPYSEAP